MMPTLDPVSAISCFHGCLLLLLLLPLLLPGEPPPVWESRPPGIWQVQQHPKLLTGDTKVARWLPLSLLLPPPLLLLLLLLLVVQLLQVSCKLQCVFEGSTAQGGSSQQNKTQGK
jgi:hypothetical protein